MAANINVFSYSYLDQRITVEANISTSSSDILFPFYTGCWLIPKSKAATYLNGDYETYKFYKVKESEYSTICLDEFLKGATTFYNQQHTNANMGFIIFEDQFALDPDNPNNITEYEDAPQANRLSVMNTVVGTIGRNAIYICVAETNFKRYSLMMDDFRQCDTSLSFIKCKVRNTLVNSESALSEIITDYKAYGATMMAIQSATASSDDDEMSFQDRADFVLGGMMLNPYSPSGSATTYKVGMCVDGSTAVLTDANVTYSSEKSNLDYITKQYLTYFQVDADDDTEYVAAGCGVYYQGSSIPANLFLLAKYAEYVLKLALYDARKQDKSGVANVTIFNNAISSAYSTLYPYVGFLLDSMTSTNYTQTEINEAIEDSTVQLSDCIEMTTYPTYLFTSATLSMSIQ